MDTLHVRGIRAYGHTGFFDAEQELGQWFAVDLAIRLDLSRTGDDDDLEHSLNYAAVVARVQELVRGARFRTIERLATVVAEAVLAFAPVRRVRVRLTKLAPPIPDFAGDVAVEILRARPTAAEPQPSAAAAP